MAPCSISRRRAFRSATRRSMIWYRASGGLLIACPITRASASGRGARLLTGGGSTCRIAPMTRMIQGRNRPRFLAEPPYAFLIGHEPRRQHFHGDPPAQAHILRQIDVAHAARAELFDDAVVGNRLANHEEPLASATCEMSDRCPLSKFLVAVCHCDATGRTVVACRYATMMVGMVQR